MPRRFGVFDYKVPDELQKKVSVGQLVIIPFRSKDVFGIVSDIHPLSNVEKDLKSISKIAYEAPLFLEKQLALMKLVSAWYGISLPTASLLFAPPLQKKKLITQTPTAHDPYDKAGTQKKLQYHVYTNEYEHAAVLLKLIQEPCLILLPTIHTLESAFNLLSSGIQEQTLIWHSQLTTKQQFERWWQVRNGQKRIILGTRGSLFLPFLHLKNIIVDHEEDANHKHFDQTPRFHAKDMASELAKLNGASLHVMSASPSVESYAAIFSGKYKIKNAPTTRQERLWQTQSTDRLPEIVDMRDERRGKNFSLFSDAAADALLQTQEDAFVFINRLGSATSVGCQDCGHTMVCETCELPLVYHEIERQLHCPYGHSTQPMILTCPKCSSTIVRLRGAGTELVEKEVRKIFGDKKTHEIIRIDSEVGLHKSSANNENLTRIIIGTEMATSHVHWEKTQTIIFVDIDKQLAIPEYLSTEHVWHTIQTVQYHRKADSQFFIQTFHSEHVVFRSLSEPDRFYRTDLNARRSYGYPPYRYLVRYLLGRGTESEVVREAKIMYTTLQNSLTNEQKTITLLPPIETQPRAYRRQFWQVMVAKLSAENWQEDLVWLNSQVPENWKVDPNPISLLQP